MGTQRQGVSDRRGVKGSSYLPLFRKHRTPQVFFPVTGEGHGPKSWESGVSHGKKMRQGNRSSLPSMVVPSGNGHSFSPLIRFMGHPSIAVGPAEVGTIHGYSSIHEFSV